MAASHAAFQAHEEVRRRSGDSTRSSPPAVSRYGRSYGETDECLACVVREGAFCGVVERDELAALDRIRKSIHLRADATLLYEGDPADSIFTITSGLLRHVKLLADGRRQVVRFAVPGEYFGFHAAGSYGYGVEAVTASIVCQFPRAALEQLCARHPGVQRQLFALACRELDRQLGHVILLGRTSIAERVAAFLLAWGPREEEGEPPAHTLVLPMRRADIADYLGTTVETVARTLTQFKHEHLISLPHSNEVVFEDFDRLYALAHGDGEAW